MQLKILAPAEDKKRKQRKLEKGSRESSQIDPSPYERK
jgi:hypothetical protein